MAINHEPNIPGTYQAKSDKLLVADAGVEPRYCTAYETGVIYISVSLTRNKDNSIFKVSAIIIQPFVCFS